MNDLIKIADKLLKTDGFGSTNIEQVKLFKSSKHSQRGPLVYSQGIIFLLQGEKHIYTESHEYSYDPENYIVITVPMPLECEGFGSEKLPLYAVAVDIDIPILNSIISQMDDSKSLEQISKCTGKCTGIYTSSIDNSIEDILKRLLQSLLDKNDSKILGESILRELYYKLIKEEASVPLYALALKNTNLSKVDLALKEIHKNYNKQFDVDTLAGFVSMSNSAFHHAFKSVTSSSPMQYLKKIRLNKARDFLLDGNIRVNQAARQVGYESVSQFNREFKRYFGVTPGSFTNKV